MSLDGAFGEGKRNSEDDGQAAAKKRRMGKQNEQTQYGPGILVSCNPGREFQARIDAIQIFERYAEAAAEGKEESREDDKNQSVGSGILAEIAEINQKKKKVFWGVDTGVKGLVYIRFLDKEMTPYSIVRAIMDEAERTKQAAHRYLFKFTPLERGCFAAVDQIKTTAEKYVAQMLDAAKPEKFAVVYKARNNDKIKRADVITAVAGAVPAGFEVDLVNPDVHIIVEIFKHGCGMSCVRDFIKYRKYNVHEFVDPNHGAKMAGVNHQKMVADGAKAEQVGSEPTDAKGATDANSKDNGGA